MDVSSIADLERLAEEMNVTLCSHTGGEKGRWHSRWRAISIRKGLGPVNHLCTLAHELGHAVLGHDSTATGWLYDLQERDADRWAARILINPHAYTAAEQRHPSAHAIAFELGVTVHVVDVWRGAQERILI